MENNMNVDEFLEELRDNLEAFSQNMHNISPPLNRSFPHWYNTLGAWLEVGTDMEEEYWRSDET